MAVQTYKNSFTPFQIGKVTIKNRYCVAPIGFIPVSAMGAYDNDGMDSLVERAKGGFGLIYTSSLGGDVKVDPFSHLDKVFPLYSPINFMRNSVFMNERIHAYGSKVFCQVSMGVGRNGAGKKAPSEISTFSDPSKNAQALTKDEIKSKIDSLVETAKLVKASDYDGIEIHSIHWGYLLDQFAMSITNKRTDEYGGSLENRLRICREIVEGIKQVCGADYPVSMRLGLKSYIKGLGYGQSSLDGEDEAGRTLEEGLEICKLLEAYGYDALSLDVGVYESFYHACPPIYIPKGNYLPLYAEAKKVVTIPVMAANRMDDPDMCENAIAEAKIDAVVLGRATLADPHYARKVETGKVDRIRPCLACNQGCLGRGLVNTAVSCAVNPEVYRGVSYGISKALMPKKIAVIGGGIAGMEAARVATLRGHEATLYEASDRLGGNLIAAGSHTYKDPVLKLNEWYQRELKELGVPIRLNTRATPNMMREMNVDAAILAVGSVPVMPNIPGIDKAISCIDALLGKKAIGQNVVVVGGGLVGCEIALDYAIEHKTVTIVEALDDILSAGDPVPIMNKMALEDLLTHNKVDIRTGHRIEEINADGAVIVSVESGEKQTVSANTVIMAIGFKPLPSMVQDFLGGGLDVYEIGDGRKVGTVLTSIWDAYEVSRGI